MSDELEQAIQVIAKVCADRQGTLADHQAIQGALAIVVNAARASKPEPEMNGKVGLELAEQIANGDE